ncbi:terminase large subunit [Nafulsella turpanensis]|uniref:terminase large subunit n=1 Tax=Nafulsella turpanensis TaxID=1265690 RepID=UPI00034A228F|nr:terminase TerL endonuclease subunit [Nafulsella turpanensis]
MTEKQKQFIQGCYTKLEGYVKDVTEGNILVNQDVLKAVQRYQRDRDSDKWQFRTDKLDKFFHFLTYIRINQEDNYVPFQPEPWQVFYFSNIYGFYYKGTDRRRFTTSFLTIARKNGKTTLAMIQSLYHLSRDGQQDAQVYVVSANSRLSGVGLDQAKNIVSHSPALKKRMRNMQYSVRFQNSKTNNFLKASTGDADSLNSIRPAAIIFDESHLYQGPELIDMGKSGQVGVNNPLCSIITTRGNNTTGWFQFDYEQYLRKVLDQEAEDESTFILMYGLHSVDEVGQPECWIKANPNLANPKILTLDQLTDVYEQKRYRLTGLRNFVIFNLNLWWTGADDGYISEDDLNEVFVDEILEELIEGEGCFMGIDLSSHKDISAISLIFPPSDRHEEYIIKNYNIKTNGKRVRKTGIDIQPWITSGDVIELESDLIDYNFLFNLIDELTDKYYIQKMGFDFYNSHLLIPRVKNDLAIEGVEIRQTPQYFNMPMKMLEKLVYDKEVIINNQCTKWQFGNVVVYEDTNGNMKPVKKKNKDSIDSVVAILNGMAAMLGVMGEAQFSY